MDWYQLETWKDILGTTSVGVGKLKADLHGTKLSHTTSLRQAYDRSTISQASCRFDLQETIHVVGLS